MDQENLHFDIVDYVVFGLLLVFSVLIGIYFAYFAKQKQNTILEYLLGGKKMSVFPIAMSLIASYISGYTMIAIPAEAYNYGTQYVIPILPELTSVFILTSVYIPVLYKLQIYSSYEYLKMRFNSRAVRTFGSFLFCVKMIMYIPVVIYLPPLVFAQVTGFDLHILLLVIPLLCIFYTTIGGLKAVVWTDTLQTMSMFLGLLVVIIIGTINAGGFAEVLKKSTEGERIEFFNLDFDPTVRYTFWNSFINAFLLHLSSLSVNQHMVQRCMALPTLEKAKSASKIFTGGLICLSIVACYTGLVVYATFYDCDPLRTKVIGKADQLVPYFVMKIAGHVPALPGIFIAGVFSAGLSTMSTGLNSLAGVIYHDFLLPCYKKPIPESKAPFIMKIMVLVLGVVCLFIAFMIEQLGGVVQIVMSVLGITGGVLLGMFTLGMLFPWATAVGALCGGVSSFALCAWIAVGAQLAVKNKQIVYLTKPMRIDGCSQLVLAHYYEVTNKTTDLLRDTINRPLPLYKISFYYYTLLGTITVIVVGLFVSFLGGANKPQEMDPDLFPPFMKSFLRPTKKNNEDITMNAKQVDSIQEVME